MNNRKNSQKGEFIKRAQELREKYDSLCRYVYMEKVLKDPADFTKVRTLCASCYVIVPDDDHSQTQVTINYINKYIEKMPKAISEIKELKEDVKRFINEVHTRTSHLLKMGHFTSQVQLIISNDELKKLASDAQEILSTFLVKGKFGDSEALSCAKGANVDIKASDIDKYLDSNLNAKGYNAI